MRLQAKQVAGFCPEGTEVESRTVVVSISSFLRACQSFSVPEEGLSWISARFGSRDSLAHKDAEKLGLSDC